jgi:hypothetical protein
MLHELSYELKLCEFEFRKAQDGGSFPAWTWPSAARLRTIWGLYFTPKLKGHLLLSGVGLTLNP